MSKKIWQIEIYDYFHIPISNISEKPECLSHAFYAFFPVIGLLVQNLSPKPF